jgi:cytochrome c553
MRRWLRWIGIGLGAVFALVLLCLATVYVVSQSHLSRRYAIPASPVVAASDSASLTWGQHLATAIGKCQMCHGPDLGGQLFPSSLLFGRLAAANLTSGRGGIGTRSDADLERAIRHGVRPDGRSLVFMPAELYAPMSDEDFAALIGYLRTVPPVDRELPPPRLGPMARGLYLFTNFPLLPAELVHQSVNSDPPEPGPTEGYGNYLTSIGLCKGCHGPGLDSTGMPGAPNLTRKLRTWSEADFVIALRSGTRPDGSAIKPDLMPWALSGQMSDDEIRAVWLYIRSLPEKPAKSE